MKHDFKDILYYLQGNVRYKLYYSTFSWLIPNHIREQITYRINSMRVTCFTEGQCEMCGCSTTALQMCNKACKGNCYPEMISKKIWKELIEGKTIFIPKEKNTYWALSDYKFMLWPIG
jgi:hypothetical protein